MPNPSEKSPVALPRRLCSAPGRLGLPCSRNATHVARAGRLEWFACELLEHHAGAEALTPWPEWCARIVAATVAPER